MFIFFTLLKLFVLFYKFDFVKTEIKVKETEKAKLLEQIAAAEKELHHDQDLLPVLRKKFNRMKTDLGSRFSGRNREEKEKEIKDLETRISKNQELIRENRNKMRQEIAKGFTATGEIRNRT